MHPLFSGSFDAFWTRVIRTAAPHEPGTGQTRDSRARLLPRADATQIHHRLIVDSRIPAGVSSSAIVHSRCWTEASRPACHGKETGEYPFDIAVKNRVSCPECQREHGTRGGAADLGNESDLLEQSGKLRPGDRPGLPCAARCRLRARA